MDYSAFLASKQRRVLPAGFTPGHLNRHLKPWQADLVTWHCRMGRSACFANTGLGKTIIELAFAEACIRFGGVTHALILCPLAVAQQTKREAEKFGIEVDVNVVRERADVRPGISVVNYDRVHKLDTSIFGAVVPDESSVMKDWSAKTTGQLLAAFSDARYKLPSTATPAPNDHSELGTHAEFLGICSRLEMLATYFKHDSGDTHEWRLRGHARGDFWQWVASWAVCVSTPADLGHPDDEYQLPPLRRFIHEISCEECPPPDGMLFHADRVSATNQHRVKRSTADARAAKVAELIGHDSEPWVIWCDTDYEADALRRALPTAAEVRGSHKTEKKEETILAFSSGQIKQLITKPEICGHGLNWQHCHKMAFVGLSFSLERQYQAVRRCWRYGQTRSVEVHVVMSDAEGSILGNVATKEKAFEEMQREVVAAVRENQLQNLYGRKVKTVESRLRKEVGDDWCLVNGDCCEVVKRVKSDSVGFSVFSPPFATLYTYSDSPADMGNSRNYDEFFRHWEFFVPELFRVMMPGRIVACHCMELPSTIQYDGVIGIKDFPSDLRACFQRYGFIYHGRVGIWKDPLLAATRTHAIELAHQQIVKDSAICRPGIADTILLLRKPGKNPVPIPHPRGIEAYYGESDPGHDKIYSDNQGKNGKSHCRWRGYASPFWLDIRQSETLNGERAKRDAKDQNDEAHICPLQTDVIYRCLELWSTAGDLVFSPFAGIGSEGYCSIMMGRKFLGVELKPSYFDVAVKHLRQAVAKVEQERKEKALF